MSLDFDTFGGLLLPGGREVGSGVPAGQFEMWAAKDPAGDDLPRLKTLLGPQAPIVSRGYGGWTQEQRAGRWGFSTWPGGETPAVTILLRIEERAIRSPSAKTKMRQLERLCGWDRRDQPPPVVQFRCNLPHHDFDSAPQNRWVCESLDWDADATLYTDRAQLVRADATLVLGLYVTTELSVTATRGFARREMKVGWNLRRMAQVYLGDPKRWKDIQSLNRDNKRCPTSSEFRVTKPVWLLVPPREDTATKKKDPKKR